MKMSSVTRGRLRPKITIELSNPKQSYTMGDQITGIVTVTTSETLFNTVGITFEGSSRVALPRPITLNREITTSHTFLKLQKPMQEEQAVVPGQSYTYPFEFTIPEELPFASCVHGSDCVDERHVTLPPTLELENLSQELCRISYLIRVIVSRQDMSVSDEVIDTATRNIHFLPVPDLENIFTYSTARETTKRIKSLPEGRLEITTLSSPPTPDDDTLKYSSNSNMDHFVCTQLRFDPIGDARPPRLRKLSAALKVSTLWNARLDASHPRYQQTHVKTTSLPSINLSATRWVKNTMSASSLGSNLNPADGLYYTASIMIPIIASDFLPTFHSCLVSRNYLLDLTLTYHTHSTVSFRRAMKLQAPLEITGRYRNEKSGIWDGVESLCPPPPPYGYEN